MIERIEALEQNQPIPNSIKINSNPSGASIYLDGTNMNLTAPATLTDVEAGNHHVRLYKTEYNEYNEYFQLEEGASYVINADLGEPLPPLPVFTIDNPQNGEHFEDNVITISGLVQLEDDDGNLSSFNGDRAILILNGVEKEISISSGGQFNETISIVSGENSIKLRANSEEGNTGVSDEIIVYGDFEVADIEITLSWNTPTSDLDLHVWDPNGEHCYYSNKNISTGSIDVDDVDGFGPEVFTSENAIDGTYVIKINCYSLDSDEYSDATVQVQENGSSIETYGPHNFTVADQNGTNSDAWWEVITFTFSNGDLIATSALNLKSSSILPDWLKNKILDDMTNLPIKEEINRNE